MRQKALEFGVRMKSAERSGTDSRLEWIYKLKAERIGVCMKKFLTVILIIAMVCTITAACSNGGTAKTDATEAPSEQATEVPTEEPTRVPVDYTEKTYDAAAVFAAAKVQGRTTLADYTISKKLGDARGIALDYTAAAVEFTAYCEGTVTMELYTKATAIGGNKMYINVLVDGVSQAEKRTDFLFKSAKVNTVTLAENLERGFHTFLIERQTEAERGVMYINSVTLTGELGEKPADKALFIEIIGDSITTGYGNLWPDNVDGEKRDSEPSYNMYVDGTRTYGVLAAKALDADYSVVAQQGIGCLVGYYSHTMSGTYTNTCYQCGRTEEWSFGRTADVVVINLGTNDWTFYSGKATKLTQEELRKGFCDFIMLVKGKNPGAKVLWCYGMMNTGCEDIIKGALEDAGGEAAGCYYQRMSADGSGGNGHPNLEAHIKNAEILENRLREILNLG